MTHGPSGVPDSCKYSLSASLEAIMFVLLCYVYLWYYILGVCMCALLELVLCGVLCIFIDFGI